MFKFRNRAATQWRTGVVHTKPARAAAIVARKLDQAPKLLQVAVSGRPQGVLAWRATQALLEGLPHRRAPVSAVLDPAEYQLLLSEKLDLPAEELRAALRWRIREQLTTPIDDTVIDVFHLPEQRGNERVTQVVATSQTSINELEAIVHGAKRRLDVVDIPELALRNLMVLMPQDATGCALILLGRTAINILITCQGVLFVARRIDPALVGDAEQLSLQLQRSLQYYESQFDRPGINELVLAPACDRARELAPQIAQATGLSCDVIDVPAFLPCEGDPGPLDQPEALLAVGAALRSSAQGFDA
jgi:MSHA biogenesis protein MshI